MDIFKSKNITPMLIGEMQEAFDNPNYIYELKLDGERCLAYLEQDMTDLRNKRNQKMLYKFPELANIHKQVKARCILDGELIVVRNGEPDFFAVQRRSLMSHNFKIQLASAQSPATFVAFDLLYYQEQKITDWPLLKRKELLAQTILENERLVIARYIEEFGVDFYQLAQAQHLEGIVAKKKDSKYYLNKRTKDWIKIKNMLDDDFVVCGYMLKDNKKISLILGQYRHEELEYRGHVTLGISRADFQVIKAAPKISKPPFKTLPSGNETAVWLKPILVCTVKYMMKTSGGFMRQAVFKGLRDDKAAKDCRVQ